MDGTISLELKLISCKDLKAFNFFQKLSIQAVVSIFDEELKTTEQRQKSPVDREGGRNPQWNHPMEFNFNNLTRDSIPKGLYLKFEVRSVVGANSLIYRTIGEARVPLKDLIDGASDHFNGMVVRFVSYQVRNTGGGKVNGVLNFAYKVKGNVYKEGVVSSNAPVSCPVETGKGRLYPCLDDVWSPLSGTRYVHINPTSQFCATPPPTVVLGVGKGVCGCSYRLQGVQTPGRSCCHASKAAIRTCYSYNGNAPAGSWTSRNL